MLCEKVEMACMLKGAYNENVDAQLVRVKSNVRFSGQHENKCP